MNKFLKGLALVLLAGTANVSNATSPLLILKGSLEYGGDKLFTAHFVDGETETTRAGDGKHLAIGVGVEHSPKWQSEATVGSSLEGTLGENGSLELSSIPYELLTFRLSSSKKWRAGGGIKYVTNMKMEGGGIIDGLAVDFENAAGVIFEADWFLGQKDRDRLKQKRGMAYFGIRGTLIDYEIKNIDRKFDGNSLGLVFGIGF